MNKDLALSLLRSILTVAGSYLLGKNLLGNSIDSTLWQEVVGAVLSLVGTVWGIVQKTATVDAISSGVRSLAIFIGGLLVASGKLSSGALDSWLGLVTTLVMVILSQVSRTKANQISDGTIKVETKANGQAQMVEVKKPGV